MSWFEIDSWHSINTDQTWRVEQDGSKVKYWTTTGDKEEIDYGSTSNARQKYDDFLVAAARSSCADQLGEIATAINDQTLQQQTCCDAQTPLLNDVSTAIDNQTTEITAGNVNLEETSIVHAILNGVVTNNNIWDGLLASARSRGVSVSDVVQELIDRIKEDF